MKESDTLALVRQLTIQVPRGRGDEVMAAAVRQEGRNLYRQTAEAAGADGEHSQVDVIVAQVSNSHVGNLLDELQAIDGLRVTLLPTGVMALRPPATEAPDQVTDVTARSPLEVYLSGLMSVGSWKGLIGYAIAAGLVVWNGLYTNTSFLLVAAMLIAPFAGPAMTLALATARGDSQLLGRSLIRYLVSVSVTVVTAFAVSMLLGQQVATQLMVERSLISEATIILPLVAGAAGALNLIRSEHDSLVSGAATGMLVAASLAPPAGVVGMASAIGEWSMVKSGLFLLCLQLVGINLAGAVVFRLQGLIPQGTRYPRGRRGVSWTAWLISLIAVSGMLTWQFWNTPELQRSSREQRAVAVVRQAVDQTDLAQLVQAQARFTRPNIPGQNTLYVQVIAQRGPNPGTSESADKQAITRLVQQQLLDQGFNVTPLVDVTLLESPQIN